MLRNLLCLSGLGLAVLLGTAAAPARAQDRGWNDGRPVVTCSSNDNRRNQCSTPFRGRAALVENLSGTRCIEGHNWGSGNGYIWVDRGCRGRFVEARGGGWGGDGGWSGGNRGTIRCESNDQRQRVCNTGWRSAVLVRQLSSTRCIEGRNWGSRNGTVWVNDGCRGEFAEGRGWGGGGGGGGWGPGGGSDYFVTCSSNDKRQRTCDWDRRQGRPYVVKQLSGTPCVEGRTWGYRGNTIWVDDGCRARFGAR
ncbi:DUF3011 domain-containing protein [[Pseudomonas] boreopolis]|uniref:DUF3011 domain-containing protein n=1 Tax=Xanthomonas boreopolis TaxID=86183 RepID=UPI003D4295BA